MKTGIGKDENNTGTQTQLAQNEIDKLPPEVGLILFTHFNAKDLFTTSLVCHQWNSYAEDRIVWREQIRQCFPYLFLTKNKEYHDNPKALYQEECNLYCKLIKQSKWDFSMQQLLASLRGDLSLIERDEKLSPENKRVLYSFAVSNGHYQILENYSETCMRDAHDSNVTDKKSAIVKMAFKFAVQNGNLSVVLHFINLARQEETRNKELRISHKKEAEDLFPNAYQHQDCVWYCVEKSQENCTESYKMFSSSMHLEAAINKEHLLVIKCLIENEDITILGCIAIANAVLVSAKKGMLSAVKYILEEYLGNYKPKDAKVQIEHIQNSVKAALLVAASAGHLSVVQYILEKQYSKIESQQECCAFFSAATEGHLLVVEYLLENAKKITSEDKKSALEIAKQCNHNDIVEIISQNLNPHFEKSPNKHRRCIMM